MIIMHEDPFLLNGILFGIGRFFQFRSLFRFHDWLPIIYTCDMKIQGEAMFMTFKKKLNLSYTLIIVSLITIITYCNYMIHLADTRSNMTRAMGELSNQLAVNMDVYLSDLAYSTTRPLYDRSQIEQLITSKRISELNSSEAQQLENYIRNTYLYPNAEDVAGVHLFDNGNESVSLFQRDQSYVTSPQSSQAFSEAQMQEGRYVISDTYLVETTKGNVQEPLFSIFRQLNVYESNHPYGMLVLDVKLTKLDELLSQIKIGEDSHVTVINDFGKVIYSTNEQEITLPAPFHNSKNWIQAKTKLHNAAWTIQLEIPLKSVSNQKYMLLSSLLIMLVSILAAILFSQWFSSKITKPLEQLQRLMKKAESGEFDLRFQTTSRDEIYHLGNSFNQMLAQIKDSIDRSYLAEIRQRDAQFSALQSQISPHFLFNTLETIRMTAEAEGNPETVKMITSLGKLLKVNVQQRSWVTLQLELEYVQHYLYLQSVRLSYPPEIKIECEEALEHIPIHALLIQPLVENSILHGLRPMSQSGAIHVQVSRSNEHSTCKIQVKDDGVGMTADRLRELRNELQSASTHSGPEESIGLLNIQRRIQLTYGNEYGLVIDSMKGQGTSVSFELPLNNSNYANQPGGFRIHEYISNDHRGR